MTGLRYVSFDNHTGYGTAARRMMHGFVSAGVPFTWTPMVAGDAWNLGCEPFEGHDVGNAEFGDRCNRNIPYDTVVTHLVPEYVLHWRQREPEKRLVLYTAWETDRIPSHWRFFLELADLVLVPSSWNKHVFESADLRVQVEALPHIAPPPAPMAAPFPTRIREGDFVFLAIDSWSRRKRLPALIRCYLQAFTAEDPVTLVIKTDARNHESSTLWRSSTTAIVRSLRDTHSRPARIELLTSRLSDEEIAGLHARADCYLSLSHGEGWGLGPFDAAAHGTPVIATGFGGTLDFLTPEDAYLVRSRLVPVDNESGRPSFMPDQHWAEPDSRHAIELMRHVVSHRDEAAAKGRRLQRIIREKFNETSVTRHFLDILQSSPASNDTKAAT